MRRPLHGRRHSPPPHDARLVTGRAVGPVAALRGAWDGPCVALAVAAEFLVDVLPEDAVALVRPAESVGEFVSDRIEEFVIASVLNGERRHGDDTATGATIVLTPAVRPARASVDRERPVATWQVLFDEFDCKLCDLVALSQSCSSLVSPLWLLVRQCSRPHVP